MTDVNQPSNTGSAQVAPRIPEHLRNRSAATKVDATGAKILAVGVSVAAGIGLIGVMATAPLNASSPSDAAATQPNERIIVIQQPVAIATPAPVGLPVPAQGANAGQILPTTTDMPAPSVTIIEQPAAAPEIAPKPVTQTEGS